MGFFINIKRIYGDIAVRKLKQWMKLNSKLARENNRKIFLLKCRKYEIIPNHITNATKNIDELIIGQDAQQFSTYNQLTRKFKFKLINLEISSNHKSISLINKSLILLKQEIINLTSEHVFNDFAHNTSLKYNKIFKKTKQNNIKKFENLKKAQINEIKVCDNWLKNISNTVIPHDISKFLALGPKFSVEPHLVKDISIKSLLSHVDYIASNIANKAERNIAIAKSTNLITNTIHNKKSNSYIQQLYSKTRIFLNNNPNLIITKSDKGNVTVVMDRTQYINHSLELLNNRNHYSLVNKDPTSSVQTKCNNLVKDLFNNKEIDNITRHKLTCYNSISAKFYALPKIHKPTLSVRPIIASINSPTEPLAKFLSDILQKAYNNNNEYYIRDSFQFSERFNNTRLPENFVLISLDVVSLFTNIPLHLCLNSIDKKWNRIKNYCDIKKPKFISLMEFLFNNTHFSFNNQFYKQIFGTPMGSSISPVLANYVMDELLDNVIPLLSFKPHFLIKYVDDIITAIPKDKINEILDVFNSNNENIQFTIETESNNSVPFLDTLVIRNENLNNILIDWYRKPIHSGRYLNFQSYHSYKMKVNLVKQMKDRVLRISDSCFHEKNLNILFKLFVDNGYPQALLRKILFDGSLDLLSDQNDINNVGHNITNNNEVETTISKYFTLPYIKELTAGLTNIFSVIDNIKIAKKTVKTINHLFTRTKDKTPILQMSNVIYRIPCHNCPMIYIGQTKSNLKQRITAHKSDSRLHPERCALADHVMKEGHIMNYGSVKILTTEQNLNKRLFLEMTFINEEDNCINKKTDINKLSTIFSFLLTFDKKQNL